MRFQDMLLKNPTSAHDSMPDHPELSARGPLDGLTILRYAQMYEEHGGVEDYLWHLNRILFARSAFATILVHLTCKRGQGEEITDMRNGARLVRVPLFVRKKYSVDAKVVQKSELVGLPRLKHVLRLALTFNSAFRRPLLSMCRRRWEMRPWTDYEPEGIAVEMERLMHRFKIDLVVLHSQGGKDAYEVIRQATERSIPVIFQNHFANERLYCFDIAEQSEMAAGVAGVSAIGVPRYLRKRFVNLSDAIDLDLFDPEQAKPSPFQFSQLLVMSGRITPEKGQSDAIEVVRRLRDSGLNPQLIFAGRADSPGFLDELKRCAVQHGLEKQVRFAGCLTQTELRDLYKCSTIFILPTRVEGLPRVLLEAQAMRVPPVVYNVGGTSAAILDGVTGFLVKKGDIAGFVGGVAKLLTSEGLRRQMGEAGRRFVEEQFSLASLAKRHEEYYLRVISAVNA
jgi:glycosyltransferase involved in cell wall biosynthesis